MKKETKKNANFRFYPSFLKRLKAQSEYERRSMTAVIEYAVELYLKDNSVGNAGEQPTGKADL